MIALNINSDLYVPYFHLADCKIRLNR